MSLETETGDEDLSLRDELSAALEAELASAPVAPAADTAAAPAAAETAEQTAQRARDAEGKFAKAPKSTQSTPEPNAPLAGQEPPKPETILPPASWSPTAKAKFAALDPDVQQEVLRREKDIEQGKAQWDQKAERFNRLDSILRLVERFQLAGLDETQAVQALFAAQDYLERAPVDGLLYLARQYGVTSQHLMQALGVPAQQQQPIHPQLQQVLQQVNSLQSVVAQQQQSATQAASAQVVSQIDQFRADPKNIYFENVRGDMSALIRSGQAKDLQDAYDKATWASPEIRPLLLHQQQQAAASAAEAEKRAKATAARHASGSVTGSPAPGSSPASSGPAPSLRDELTRAFSEAS